MLISGFVLVGQNDININIVECKYCKGGTIIAPWEIYKYKHSGM